MLDTHIAKLKNNMTALKKAFAKSSHIESGSVGTGFPHSLHMGSGVRHEDRSVKFQNIYGVPPRVILGTTHVDGTTSGGRGIRYQVYVHKVDIRGFTVRFTTWADSITTGVSVSWVSIPAST